MHGSYEKRQNIQRDAPTNWNQHTGPAPPPWITLNLICPACDCSQMTVRPRWKDLSYLILGRVGQEYLRDCSDDLMACQKVV